MGSSVAGRKRSRGPRAPSRLLLPEPNASTNSSRGPRVQSHFYHPDPEIERRSRYGNQQVSWGPGMVEGSDSVESGDWLVVGQGSYYLSEQVSSAREDPALLPSGPEPADDLTSAYEEWSALFPAAPTSPDAGELDGCFRFPIRTHGNSATKRRHGSFLGSGGSSPIPVASPQPLLSGEASVLSFVSSNGSGLISVAKRRKHRSRATPLGGPASPALTTTYLPFHRNLACMLLTRARKRGTVVPRASWRGGRLSTTWELFGREQAVYLLWRDCLHPYCLAPPPC